MTANNKDSGNSVEGDDAGTAAHSGTAKPGTIATGEGSPGESDRDSKRYAASILRLTAPESDPSYSYTNPTSEESTRANHENGGVERQDSSSQSQDTNRRYIDAQIERLDCNLVAGYLPDERPPGDASATGSHQSKLVLYRNPLFLVSLAVCLVVAAVATGIELSQRDSSSPSPKPPEESIPSPSTFDSTPSYAPSFSPTTFDIERFIAPFLPENKSAQYQANYKAAIAWLNADPQISLYTAYRLRQRYALAIFFYQTSLFPWMRSDGWLTNSSECTWYTSSPNTTVCTEDETYAILNLFRNGLDGALPTDIVLLTGLQSIQMADNKIRGTIPPVLGNLSNLEVIDLGNNLLSGGIPASLFEIPHMPKSKTPHPFQRRRFARGRREAPSNESQEFRIKASPLRRLELGINMLSGSIPTEIGMAANLEFLSFKKNSLTGKIPTEIGALRQLQWFDISNNQQISGPVPTEM
jgi:hypothetical protein